MKHTLLAQRLLALACAGWLLLDFPLLRIALGGAPEATLFGWPRLAWLLFAFWALVIVVLAVLMERGDGDD
ncbi:MAG: hypothetical protein KGL78_02675 [Burkholderiales bacterium]|nr:hypothetical protein [Burkholderiales bacterium]